MHEVRLEQALGGVFWDVWSAQSFVLLVVEIETEQPHSFIGSQRRKGGGGGQQKDTQKQGTRGRDD